MKYWLIKSEPKTYSISDMKSEKNCIWDGVRNYQARNFLRQMNQGDLAFFYHSNIIPPGIVGLVRVLETNISDPTQFDPKSKYYDPKSTPNSPRWQTVSVEFIEEFPSLISLATLKQKFREDELLVIRRGNRLSVMPVAEDVAEKIFAIKNQE
ncbi:MAG: EVE domain-containing protein [Microcoleaceae cyanobacterium MO_207.B10]|nr:EVE domain-containing protein [Microcoleaceae cyanobacterium MO_207.B10]